MVQYAGGTSTMLYRCPAIAINVQDWVADDGMPNEGEVHEGEDLSGLYAAASCEPGDRQSLGI
jgi:hypothetical protein